MTSDLCSVYLMHAVVMLSHMSCHSCHLRSPLCTHTCVHLNTVTCTASPWQVSGARPLYSDPQHPPAHSHSVSYSYSYIGWAFSLTASMNMSYPTCSAPFPSPPAPPHTDTDTGGGTVREMSAGRAMSLCI